MSVYIKMEMPKECIECQFNIPDKDGYPRCVILHRFIIDGDTFNNCPLVGIKTPHGRLIDRDAVPEVSADPFEEAAFQDVLDDMPVILEAEE